MRDKALRVPLPPGYQVVDCCGTGGDKSNTFNISTAAAIVAAAAGARLAKHGNRSVTSRCGSADVLEGLGVRIEATPEQVERCVQERALVEQLGRVLALMGTRHAIMVHGLEGLDEVSISGPTLVCEVRGRAHPTIDTYEVPPK